MMTIGDREGRILISHPHTYDGYFFNASFCIRKIGKCFNSLRRHFNITLTSRNDGRLVCGRRAAVRFYLSLGLVRVFEI